MLSEIWVRLLNLIPVKQTINILLELDGVFCLKRLANLTHKETLISNLRKHHYNLFSDTKYPIELFYVHYAIQNIGL